MEIKKGQKIDLLGHKLEVKEIYDGDVRTTPLNQAGYPDRAVLSCRPHCCTSPRHVTMELPLDALKEALC
jgi:hypothetical protein